MQRYFASYSTDNNCFFITGEDCHHISKVMRMKEKDEIICVSDDQRTALCSIAEISTDQVTASVIQWKEESVELPVTVTIVSGLPKGDKMEWIIQKGTELGAAKFIPFTADRSVVKWDGKKADKKITRWKKIAKEAAEQSHRTVIPEITEPVNLSALLKDAKSYDVKLVAYEEEARQGEVTALVSSLKGLEKGGSLLIVFGPEGGLTDNEVEKLKADGFHPCGLGPRILRTETAPLYLLSAVSYQLELLEVN
ncbi:16S rRNA (uracil(1498)-N(3))-methyltransferase [Bacillus tuaregi]|uniref:16S rRNA (uracil(1498)-N(3))-methyltransferase n=1 Tax=Bacillus tuaregi TaxID=1816695 RepID=UPI0008F91615|nr:16S rRNA (uracil(1498)-N(3))-methyltransferase [Bacillus tuaregi]